MAVISDAISEEKWSSERPPHLPNLIYGQALSLSSDGLDQVAADCGFASASELCRAFKAQFHLPPAVWRKNLVPPYQEPKAQRGETAKSRPDSSIHRKLGKYFRLTAK